MEIIAELPPQRSLDKLISLSKALSSVADAIDVPDAPMGRPAPSSAIISAVLRSLLFPPPEVIAHVRLLDVSELGAVNIAKALELAGVRRLLLLRGDRPAVGDPCFKEPEKVMGLIRSDRVNIRLGLLLSLARPIEEVMRRVAAGADFYLVTRPWRSPNLKRVASEVRRLGGRTYVYLVVETHRNAHALVGVPQDERVRGNELAEAIKSLSGVVDGVVISSPGDKEALVESLRAARAVTG